MRLTLTPERLPWPFASLYEKATRLVIESYYSGLAQEVAEFLEKGRILDLGTGPGYLPVQIAKRAPAITVLGIDLSRSLIKMARRNAANAGLANRLHFEVGNAGRLRFSAESFDMVLSTGMLHMLRDPVAVLRESHRVLRCGREAWFLDPARVSSQIDKEKWKASFSLFERFMYIALSIHVRLDPPKTVTKSDALQMIRPTPFKTFRITENKGEIRVRLKKDPAP